MSNENKGFGSKDNRDRNESKPSNSGGFRRGGDDRREGGFKPREDRGGYQGGNDRREGGFNRDRKPGYGNRQGGYNNNRGPRPAAGAKEGGNA